MSFSRSHRVQGLPRAETTGHAYTMPYRQNILYSQPPPIMRPASYRVSPPFPSPPASAFIWNGHTDQVFEATEPDIFTDYNTLANCYIRSPIWATVDDEHWARRGHPPARSYRGLPIPSPDTPRRPQRTETSVSRFRGIITSPPASSGGDTFYMYYSSYQYQASHSLIPGIEDVTEDEDASEPASTTVSDPSSVMEFSSHYHERHLRPLSGTREQATTAAPRPAGPKLKKFKKAFHWAFNNLRKKRPPKHIPPSPHPAASALPIAAGTTRAITLSPSTRSTYDIGPYTTSYRPNAGVPNLERTSMPQPHPLTLARIRTAERVRQARQTGSSELRCIEGWNDGVRQLHDQQDRIVDWLTSTRPWVHGRSERGEQGYPEMDPRAREGPERDWPV
jgi:hypothetical protein